MCIYKYVIIYFLIDLMYEINECFNYMFNEFNLIK